MAHGDGIASIAILYGVNAGWLFTELLLKPFSTPRNPSRTSPALPLMASASTLGFIIASNQVPQNWQPVCCAERLDI